MPSLCDQCYAPGSCCKKLWLSTKDGPITTWTDDGEAGAVRAAESRGLPFLPLSVDGVYEDENGRHYQSWLWSCPKLQADGRCGIYDERPALCRNYAPASDGLCVHFNGAEAGDPTLMAA